MHQIQQLQKQHLHRKHHLQRLVLTVLNLHISPTSLLQRHLHKIFFTGVLTKEFFYRNSYQRKMGSNLPSYGQINCETRHHTTIHHITLHYEAIHHTTIHHITKHHKTMHHRTIHHIRIRHTIRHHTAIHHIAIHRIPGGRCYRHQICPPPTRACALQFMLFASSIFYCK